MARPLTSDSAATQTSDHGPWVCGLEAVTPAQLPVVGGKAAGLAGLLRAGLPVPDGFVVLTGAYRRFVEAHGLRADIDRTLAALQTAGEAAVEPAAAALARRFTSAPAPVEVAADIRAAYDALGRPRVAVRSSSAQEDLEQASFAGQYETFLNVGDADALLRAVVGCWASAWGGRVLAYRSRRGLGGDVDHAVVVQRQVDGRRAGVVFTADPMTGRRDRVRVSGAWGLGEAVVDGHVTPDEWLVDAADLRVLERRVADKAVWTVATDAGTETVPAPAARRRQPTLTDAEAVDLARLGRRAHDAFGSPQDLEWVGAGDGLLLVQSRPITTLFPLPEPRPRPDEGLRVYVSFNRVTQGVVEPFTPMGAEAWRLLLSGIAALARGRRKAPLHPRAHTVAAGRVYLDCTAFLNRPRLVPAVTDAFALKDPVAARIVRELVEREADELGRHRRRGALPWPLLGLVPGLLARMLYAAARPEAAAARIVRIAEADVDRLAREAEQLAGVEQRLAWLERARVTPIAVVVRQWAGYGGIALPLAEAAEARLARHVGPADAFAAVHHSPPGNPTAQMGLDLLEAARQVRDSGRPATAEHPAVTAFLARYGHRTVLEIDLGLPRWREDPERVLGWIAEAAADPELDGRLARDRQAVAAADRRAAEILARVPGRLRRRLAGWLLRRARLLVGLRERPKFDEARFLEVFRRVLLAAGAELAAAGRLDTPEDVMFLTFADLRAGGDLRALVEANRRGYRREHARTSIPRVLTSTGEAIYSLGGDHDGLDGVAASPGVVEGRVRIVRTPDAGALAPGEILVTHSTDPAWTPLLLRAGGVIMETGGPYMHGAIVAREQGIPAVAGLEGITSRLRDGDQVRLDGEAGTVTVL